MLELVVDNLDGKHVATVIRKAGSEYTIHSEDPTVRQSIEEALSRASHTGLALRSDKRQRMEHGVKFQRLARWLKPEDDEFLQALADDLIRYRLFAYTVETSASP